MAADAWHLLVVKDQGVNKLDVRGDKLVEAQYNLNKDQEALRAKKGGHLIALRSDDFDVEGVNARKSRIDAVLIQSRGSKPTDEDDEEDPCSKCEAGGGPFAYCIRIKNYAGGCCGNCKWNDQATKCQWAEVFKDTAPAPPPESSVQTRTRTVKPPAQFGGIVKDPGNDEVKFMKKNRKDREGSQEL